TDAAGQIAETIHLENRASKGKTGGCTIPMRPDVHAAFVMSQTWRGDAAGPDRPVLFSERGGGLSPATACLWSLLFDSLILSINRKDRLSPGFPCVGDDMEIASPTCDSPQVLYVSTSVTSSSPPVGLATKST